MQRLLFSTTTAVFGCVIVVVLLSGCTGSTPAPPSTATTGNTTSPATAADAGQAIASTGSSDIGRRRRPNERWADANGVEYLGNVPLDVFHDQPYAIVQDATPVGGTTQQPQVSGMGGSAAPPPVEDPEPVETAAAEGADNWADIIPLETLKSEVNSIRNALDKSLRTVGDYNAGMLSIPPKAAAIAALATIAMEHPEEITWKEDAKYIREFAKQMNENALQRGKKDQSRLLVLFENMTDTLNRSKPADLPEPPAEDSFVDVAEMRLVMFRMESAQKRMKNEAGSETAFGTQKDMISHEAAILGTMTKVVTMAGYGYEDDPEFLGYAKRITGAAMEIRGAVDANDFESYDLALSKISTACTECHLAFKE